MNPHEITEAANQLTIQRLLTRFLSDCPRYATCEIAGATIIIEPARHRTGVPKDAQAVRYIITCPSQGWSMIARSVWRDGSLYAPIGVHTRVESYSDLAGHGGEEAAATAANRWLTGLDL